MIYPDAWFRPLGPQTERKMRGHDIICLHTMVGYLASTDAMFKRHGYRGTESHFGIGGVWGGDRAKLLDGQVWQWQDTGYEADANLNGALTVISIETADNAPRAPEDIAEWTPAQCVAISKLVAWLCLAYDIPPKLIPDTRPGRRGIGYHQQGCEHSSGIGTVPGFLVLGGVRWSSSIGKCCPGPKRIAQITRTIIPMVISILTGDDMDATDWAKLKKIVGTELATVLTTAKIVPNLPLDKGGAQGGNWTTAGVLAAGDRKHDLRGRTLGELGLEIAAMRVAQVEQGEAIASILALLNADPEPTPDAA